MRNGSVEAYETEPFRRHAWRMTWSDHVAISANPGVAAEDCGTSNGDVNGGLAKA